MKHLFAFSMLLGLAQAATAQNFSFQVASYPGSGGALNLAAADLNGDNRRDLVTVNGNSVDVFLATATGSFQRTNYPFASTSPYQYLSIGDITGDGRPDLLLNSSFGGYFLLMPNADAGAFSAVVTCSEGNSPFSWGLALGDFNRDGKKDLAAPGGTLGPGAGPGIYAYHSLGNGQFAVAGSYATKSAQGSLQTADLNSDGYDDVVLTAPTTSYRYVYLSTPTGLSTTAAASIATPNTTRNFSLLDVNADGRPDYLEEGTAGYQVSYQTSAGAFGPLQAISFATSPGYLSSSAPQLADFDQDGLLDLVSLRVENATSLNAALFIQRNLGGGQFAATPQLLPIGRGGNGALAVADFNQDGRPDIAVLDGGTAQVFWNTTVLRTRAAALASVSFYPNPARGTLRLQAPTSAFPLQLTLLNALGQPVTTRTLTAADGSVDVSRLPAGSYVARLRDAQGRSSSQPLQLQ